MALWMQVRSDRHTPGDTELRLHFFNGPYPWTDECENIVRKLRRKIAMIGHRMLCQRSAYLRSRPFVPISTRSAHRSFSVHAQKQQTSALPRLQPLDGTLLKIQLKIRVPSSPLLVSIQRATMSGTRSARTPTGSYQALSCLEGASYKAKDS